MKNFTLFINGNLGLQVLQKIIGIDKEVKIIGVVLNSIDKRSLGYLNEVKETLGNSLTHLIEYKNDLNTHKQIESMLSESDFSISALFGHKLPFKALSKVKGQIINLHPSLLPIGRGADPIPWSIIEQKKQGISIHLIDNELDTGDLLFQKEIPTDISMNSGKIYQIATDELFYEFNQIFSDWINKKVSFFKQIGGETKTHKSIELNERRIIRENETGTFGDFLRIMQAMTFSDGRGPILRDNSSKLWDVNIVITPKPD